MRSSAPSCSSLLRRLATATCLVALLPIGMGSLVTTMKAGMAFADWPSSDGQNMLLYPWLSDFRVNNEKFVEHGHRLAGVLIGMVSVALACAGWREGGRHRGWTLGILLAVIAQGGLGGARVLFDRGTLAMLHSITGACFFSFCLIFRLSLLDGWRAWMRQSDSRFSVNGFAFSLLAPLVVLAQYVLGGALRHLHILRTEHVLSAVFVTLVCVAAAWHLLTASHRLLRYCGIFVVAALSTQVLLGLGALATRFGAGAVGYVAVSGSFEQAFVCSLHTVTGMFLFAATNCSALSVLRLRAAGRLTGLTVTQADLLRGGAA
ncbi:MAG: COX15/CtaA family protein [Planctomyces sp.]